MADRTYVFRLVGDFGTVTPGAEAAARSVDKLGDAQDGFARRTAAASTTTDRFATKSLAAMANGTKLTRQEVLALNYTLSDVAASLASGASPFTILLQQGGQVRDSFGGFGPLFSKLGGLITPARLAVGTFAATTATLAAAFYQGQRESLKLQDSLVLTGNQAGITEGRFNQLAQTIADVKARPIADVRDALQTVVSTGSFGPGAIEAVTNAVISLQRFSGESAQTIVKDFASMKDGVTKWAAEHNRQYNFLTVEQYRFIRSLEAQGRVQTAIAVTAQALDDKFKNQQRNLGLLDRAVESSKRAWSGFWDVLKGIGRDTTPEERLAGLRQELERRTARGPTNDLLAGSFAKGNQRLKDQIAIAESDVREARNLAERQAQAGAEVQEKIRAEQREQVDATISIDRAGYAQRQAMAEVARAKESAALDQQYKQQEISQQRYVERRFALEKASIDAQAANIQQEIALEQRRPVSTPAEQVQQQARLLDLQTRRIAVESQYIALRARRDNGQLVGEPRELRESPQAAFRQLELEQTQATEQGYRERQVAAKQSASEILQVNKDLGIALIRDDRERGLAVIAAEEEQLRRRLDLGALVGADRKAAEDSIASYVVLRNQQLTEELKPEWQRMLDAWADTTGQMKRYGDEFMSGFLRTGQQTWQDWAVSGKLSTRGITDFIKSEFARLAYEQFLAQHTASLGKTILSGVVSGIGALFGGSKVPVADGSGATGDFARFDRAATPMATGTNYVPYDGFRAELHEGEAVVPKEYNPAAGGAAADRGVNIAQTLNVGQGVSRGEVWAAVRMANAELEAKLLRSRRRGGAFA